MVIDLQGRIGSEPEVDTTMMKTWLNQGLITFCGTDDYHWLEGIKYASTVAGQSEYEAPSNLKRMIELKIDGERYKYVRFEQRDMQPTDSKHYSILNNKLYISPTPDTTSSANIAMAYVKRPTKMSLDTDSPSDSDIAGLPEVYHEALVLYAFSIYNTYDEEHGEAQSLMGSELRPIPGSFYYFIKLARKEEDQRKKGQRTRMISTDEYYGHKNPNSTSGGGTVLGN
jgi:hypothetical protein